MDYTNPKVIDAFIAFVLASRRKPLLNHEQNYHVPIAVRQRQPHGDRGRVAHLHFAIPAVSNIWILESVIGR